MLAHVPSLHTFCESICLSIQSSWFCDCLMKKVLLHSTLLIRHVYDREGRILRLGLTTPEWGLYEVVGAIEIHVKVRTRH